VLCELNDVGGLAAILTFVIIEADERRFHDIDAGDVLRNRETVGIFLCQSLKVFDDIEQIACGRVARFGRPGARRAGGTEYQAKKDEREEMTFCEEDKRQNILTQAMHGQRNGSSSTHFPRIRHQVKRERNNLLDRWQRNTNNRTL